MVKLEEVVGGSVQFHFNIADVLHKIVVISNGITYIYDEDDVPAMLKTWMHAGEPLESDSMAVSLVNGFMTAGEEDGKRYIYLSAGDRKIKCSVDTCEITEELGKEGDIE